MGWLLTSTNASDQVEAYTNNIKGLNETFVDKKGQTFTYSYSLYNELTHVSVTDSTGQEVHTEDYEYDPTTRLITEESNSEGQVLTYKYD
ncbi:hypothetical protein V1503_23790 [Bacillus sp. SCS-151]|uniref:hypothetical protein n=1 Tax=Nanhaiella sioensis TaxID=3115293 RepID=UPI00397DB79D